MEEEFEPKRKTEEEPKEVKEEVKKEVREEIKEDIPKEKGKVGRIISRIIWAIISICIIFEVVMGLLNMQRINEDKEPIWCFSKNKETTKNKTEETCDLGLYVIVKTKEGNETRTSLKPFFIK